MAVMYAGYIIEMAPVRDLYVKTSHPYTLGLLESIPNLEGTEERLVPIKGSPPDLLDRPPGCPFAPRCRFVVDRCREENPPLVPIASDHYSACWMWEEVRNEAIQTGRIKPMAGTTKHVDDIQKQPSDILLEIQNLKKHFPIYRGVLRRRVGAVKAVDGISFNIRRGETLGLVGESGCGKSTAGETILQLLEPTDGQVVFMGQNLTTLKDDQLRQIRRHMQMIFQDPYASLNPRHTVGNIISVGLHTHNVGRSEERHERVAELMEMVGLNPSFATVSYTHLTLPTILLV